MDVQQLARNMAENAVVATRSLRVMSGRRKTAILHAMADALEDHSPRILEQNELDLADAENDGLIRGQADALRITQHRLAGMAKTMRAVASLKDPIGTQISRWLRPNGLEVIKKRVPIGVIAMIYESRPTVTSNAVALCLKTSNAVILRGGERSRRTNVAICNAVIEGGIAKKMPEHAVQFVDVPYRAMVRELVQLEGLIDLVIPRGGESLVSTVAEFAKVPVIRHRKGVCHVFVDEAADLEMALSIAESAKCTRPGMCTALETLLVHEAVAATFLPMLSERMVAQGVELRGDEAVRQILPDAREATEEDWFAEYMDLILAVRVVKDVDSAAEHINKYGSHLAESIVTEKDAAAKLFEQEVDSAVVYLNASTRFTNGNAFGMGADIGISTDKLHARGPMGLEELTTYKFVVRGKGQIV